MSGTERIGGTELTPTDRDLARIGFTVAVRNRTAARGPQRLWLKLWFNTMRPGG